MKSTKILLNKIKEFEGLRLKAYKCPAGVWTIGYGHTGAAVNEHLTITQEIADDLLRLDVEQVEKVLATYKLPKLTAGQYDAIVDFCYNLGCAKFRGSTLYKKIVKNPTDATIPAEFRKWCHAGSIVLKGLVRRRNWEVERWQA